MSGEKRIQGRHLCARPDACPSHASPCSALAAGNDRTKYYACSNTNEGSNVISAAFDTKALTMVRDDLGTPPRFIFKRESVYQLTPARFPLTQAVAWERSSGANWRPAW